MKRLRLKKWVKIAITILIIVTDIIIYHYLGVKGSYIGENTLNNIIIPAGWFWLLFGQIIVFYSIWGD